MSDERGTPEATITIVVECEHELSFASAFPDWKPGDPIPTADDVADALTRHSLRHGLHDWGLDVEASIEMVTRWRNPHFHGADVLPIGDPPSEWITEKSRAVAR